MASLSQLSARLVDLFGTPSSANPTKLLNNLQVSPNGNVLVGSGTDDGVEKLQVTGATKITGALTATANITTSTNLQSNGGYLIAGATGSGSAAVAYRYDGYTSTWNGSTQAWGTYYAVARGDGQYYFHWSGQSGTPSWVWGGSDGTNMYVYNPANFSVNYANSAGSVGGVTNPLPTTGGTITGGLTVNGGITNYGVLTCTTTANMSYTTGTWTAYTNHMANGSSGTYAGAAQGSYMGWNDSNGGGEGMLCCNLGGGGTGGWVLRTVNVNNSVEYGRFTVSKTGTGTNGSDIRLKQNVETLSGSLDKILSVRPVSYQYKLEPEVTHMGVIAQEIQEVFPDVVTVTHDNHEHKDLLGVCYTDLIAPLVGAVQELSVKLDAALKRIQTLEDQLKEKE